MTTCPQCGSTKTTQVPDKTERIFPHMVPKCKNCGAIWVPGTTKTGGIWYVIWGCIACLLFLPLSSGPFMLIFSETRTLRHPGVWVLFLLGFFFVWAGANALRHGILAIKGKLGDPRVLEPGAKPCDDNVEPLAHVTQPGTKPTLCDYALYAIIFSLFIPFGLFLGIEARRRINESDGRLYGMKLAKIAIGIQVSMLIVAGVVLLGMLIKNMFLN